MKSRPGMELQKFVSKTLREVMAGVRDAQEYATTIGAEVNPAVGEAKVEDNPSYVGVRVGRTGFVPVKQIEFDIAVTSSDSAEQRVGAGIFVVNFGAGVKSTSNASDSSISRVRFGVPVAFPRQ